MFSSIFGILLVSIALQGNAPEINPSEKMVSPEWGIDLSTSDDPVYRVTRDYFTELTGKPEMVAIVMDRADQYQIPYTLAFALAFKESSFDPRQISANATSVDRGLFQLNSLSFPDLSEEDCFDIFTNADRGLGYLRYCWNRGGNSTLALAMYNAGPTRVEAQGTPSVTMTYIHRIYLYQDHYDKEIERMLALNPYVLRDSVKCAKKLDSLIEQSTYIN